MNAIFRVFLAGILAVALAYTTNRWLWKPRRGPGALLGVAFTEELSKSGMAMLTGAPLVPAHLLFGLAEAALDLKFHGSRGLLLGSVALAAHGLLGCLTSLVLQQTGGWVTAVGAASAAHALWNWAVAGFVHRV